MTREEGTSGLCGRTTHEWSTYRPANGTMARKAPSRSTSGVFFPAVAKLADQPEVKGVPKEYECTLRRRLGMLAHHERDHWWSVRPGTELAKTSRELADAWTEFGVPWMESVSTLQGTQAELERQGNPFMAGVVSLARGDRETAAALVVESLRRLPRAEARTREWAARHGLL
jgi:Domain of unknown function (DUF4304)